MGNIQSAVGFQATVLYRGKSYDKPLFDSDFLSISDTAEQIRFLENYSCNETSDNDARVYAWKHEATRKISPSSSFLLAQWMSLDGMFISSTRGTIKSFSDFPFYENAMTGIEEIVLQIEIINHLRRAYFPCISLLKDATRGSPTADIFYLLNAIRQYYNSQLHFLEASKRIFYPALSEIIIADEDGLFSEEETAKYNSDFFERKRKEITQQKGYSIADVFDDFVKQHGIEYSKYEMLLSPYQTKKDKVLEKTGNGATQRPGTQEIHIPFWETRNPDLQERLRLGFIAHCKSSNLPEDLQQLIISRDIKALAAFCLDALDEQLMEKTKESQPMISTKKGELYWSANDPLTAEYLCLYRDLMQQRQFRVCPLCKAVFYVEGRNVNRTYCYGHTRRQVDYFYQKLRAGASVVKEAHE